MSSIDRTSQRGQAIALFTLALTAIVLGTAVVVDGGYAFAQRRQAQNAADFAAMAGTRIVGVSLVGLPASAGTAANVENAVTEALTANDAQLVSAEYVDHTGAALGPVVGANVIPSDAFGVVVEARTNWQPFLLGIAGIGDWVASATATAITPGKSLGGAVLPVGIEDDLYNAMTACPAETLGSCLQQALTPGHLIQPGNFGWLTFGIQGNGGKCDWDYSLGMRPHDGCESNQPFLQSQIWPDPDDHGCCDPVGSVDEFGRTSEDKIGMATGNMWADLSHYIDNRIPVWVPIYSDCNDTGSNAYCEIVGFGGIVFMGSGDGSPHAKWLQGSAVETPWCWSHDEETGTGDKFCQGPGGSFRFDYTGEVQLRR